MRITVDIEDKKLRDIIKLTGQKKKGAAIREAALAHLRLRRRLELADSILSGKAAVDYALTNEELERDEDDAPSD